MTGSKVFISLAILLVALTSTSQGASFEQFFDAVLKAVIKSKGDYIDPLPLDDKACVIPSREFLIPSPVRLNISLTAGQLTGLKALRRSGAAVQSVDYKNDKVTRVQLAAAPVTLTTDVNVTTGVLFVGLPEILLRVNATIESLDCMIELVANKSRKEINVTAFVVDELKHLKVHFYRESLFFGNERKAWILNQVTKVVTKVFKKQVVQEVQVAVKQLMQEKIDALPDNVKRLLYG